MSDLESRIAQIEHRLSRLEQLFSRPSGTPASAPPATLPAQAHGAPWPGATPKASGAKSAGAGQIDASMSSVTAILGWIGAAAMVLAAIYFIRLAIDAGWLTPPRQIALAAAAGLGLIATGLSLRHAAREYAAYLPAAGVVVLFGAIYGAHLYYGLIGAPLASVAVIAVCVLALWLGAVFRSDLFGLFAVVGSYSAPFFLPTLRSHVTDLVIYFSAWSVLFSVYAIVIGRRTVYLAALYMALLSFDFLWRWNASGPWFAAAAFQMIQLVVFGFAAAVFSIRKQSPMDNTTAILHLPALLIFYVAEYSILKQHVPDLAPWIAVASFGVLLACYGLARAYLKHVPSAGRFLISCYAALVLFHAVYIELVPAEAGPWAALVFLGALGALAYARIAIGWPVTAAVFVIMGLNYLRVVSGFGMDDVPGKDALAVIYAAQLYAAYYFVRRHSALVEYQSLLLYAGHLSAMAAAMHLLDGRLAVSATWGALAVGALLIGIAMRDKVVAQSSLALFAATGIKVLLYDLGAASPTLRIVLLLVLGVTFYLGGWLYRRVSAL